MAIAPTRHPVPMGSTFYSSREHPRHARTTCLLWDFRLVIDYDYDVKARSDSFFRRLPARVVAMRCGLPDVIFERRAK